MHLLPSFHTELQGNQIGNNTGSVSQCCKQSISNNNANNNNNRMYRGIVQMLTEQEETFTKSALG